MRGLRLGGHFRAGLVAAACATGLLAAGSPAWAAVEEGEVAQVVVEEGAESPAAVFEGMKAAAEAKDYDALVRLYTPEARRAAAAIASLRVWRSGAPGWSDMSGRKNGMGPEELKALHAKSRTLRDGFTEMREKYGVPQIHPDQDVRPEEMSEETLDKLLDSVGDGSAFHADYMRVNREVGEDWFRLVRMEDGPRDGWRAGTGTARVVMLDNEGQEQTILMHFVRIDGRWYFEVAPNFRRYVRSVFGDRLAP
ncbi:MAG: hypothetical protein AAGA57_01940 [Planctomycetota bacterium]